ncbi:MAG: hypothetical protein IJ775_06690 [Muribaculaceae bacterium]|nr:hypothetical protein [Muribaculaceae bacterium]
MDPSTVIDQIYADKAVASVRYYNMAGQQITNPAGITIPVTTYTDGTTSSAKVVKYSLLRPYKCAIRAQAF